ncbi:acyltransferase family protein [Lutibacter sp.]|uniref:acyltransferase family protein n=1 Tax=Lutibacter sp. TaxID=1925666 RepID=UPI0034A08D86
MAIQRLIALDVLRGLTIALMIMVNTPGSWSYVYPPLLHAKWHGCTPTDLVFPFFLFIVGVSMFYSFKKFDKGISVTSFKKVIKRTLIIFLLGLFLNLFPKFDFENVRILGVLQRIAIVYGLTALLCLQFNVKVLKYVFVSILLGYWGLLYFGNPIDSFAETGNLVQQLDFAILGENHMYKGLGFTFDPEGLLSSLPSIATVLLGYFVGNIIENSKNTLNTVKSLVVYGVILTVIGLVWGTVFPINKSLWTSTYVLYTGGLALLFLALLLWVIDVKGVRKWTRPFIHFGINPLFIYMFSGLYVQIIIYLIKIKGDNGETISGYGYLYNHIFVPIAGNMNGSLLFAITHIIFFWFLTYILYKRKIFIKI